eukprot:Platyproteum_vivax@DN6932_c0_g1_i1.p1
MAEDDDDLSIVDRLCGHIAAYFLLGSARFEMLQTPPQLVILFLFYISRNIVEALRMFGLIVYGRILPVLNECKKAVVMMWVWSTLQIKPKYHPKKDCVICMENELDCVLQPCMHAKICLCCSRKISYCPICRRLISKRLKIYL